MESFLMLLPAVNKKALTVKLGVLNVLQVCPRAKVDELQVSLLHVHEQVLVLNVPVEDADLVDLNQRGNELLEEVSRYVLGQRPLEGDEVKKILDGMGALRYHDETVRFLVVVYELDDTRYVRDFP